MAEVKTAVEKVEKAQCDIEKNIDAKISEILKSFLPERSEAEGKMHARNSYSTSLNANVEMMDGSKAGHGVTMAMAP